MQNSKKVVALVVVASLAIQSCASTEKRSTHISVIGEAIIDTSPDTAVILVSVVTQSKAAITAQQENARRSSEIQKAVTAIVGKDATLSSKGYSLSPQHRYDAKSIPSIIGYEARNTLEIAIPASGPVGEVIDAATKAGANSVDNVSFERRNLADAHARSVAEASKRAMAKAQAMASALGARIVRIHEGNEIGPEMPRPMDAAGYDRRMSSTEASAAQATPMIPGMLRMGTAVRLVVEIAENEK
jgi:uncharacterized protein